MFASRLPYVIAHSSKEPHLLRNALKLNSLPFNSTGEVTQNDGLWRVYEFTWQMDAILFWDRFEGRWLRGTEFCLGRGPSWRSLCALGPRSGNGVGRSGLRAKCERREAA
jgi:hypothetical protein